MVPKLTASWAIFAVASGENQSEYAPDTRVRHPPNDEEPAPMAKGRGGEAWLCTMCLPVARGSSLNRTAAARSFFLHHRQYFAKIAADSAPGVELPSVKSEGWRRKTSHQHAASTGTNYGFNQLHRMCRGYGA